MRESKNQSISYVLAVHNEEDVLEKSVAFLRSKLAGFGQAEILLVENASQDRSWDICRRLSETESPIPVRAFPEKNAGMGYAYDRGLRESLATHQHRLEQHWIGLAAADLPYDLTDLVKFEKLLLTHPDVLMAIGSKSHPESALVYQAHRRFLSSGFRLIRRIVLGMRTGDPMGSVFVRGDVAALLAPKVKARDYFHSAELVYLAEQRGWMPIELPIVLSPSKRPSRVRPIKDSYRMLRNTFRLRFSQ